MGKNVRVRIMVNRLLIWASKNAFSMVKIKLSKFDSNVLGTKTVCTPFINALDWPGNKASRAPKKADNHNPQHIMTNRAAKGMLGVMIFFKDIRISVRAILELNIKQSFAGIGLVNRCRQMMYCNQRL
jgi:hypothetical protein